MVTLLDRLIQSSSYPSPCVPSPGSSLALLLSLIILPTPAFLSSLGSAPLTSQGPLFHHRHEPYILVTNGSLGASAGLLLLSLSQELNQVQARVKGWLPSTGRVPRMLAQSPGS